LLSCATLGCPSRDNPADPGRCDPRCKAGKTCWEGRCRAGDGGLTDGITDGIIKCDASNCSGCCDGNGKCQEGKSHTVCGFGGLQCKACGGSDGICVDKVGCVGAYGRKWHITALSAVINQKDSSGGSWDTFGSYAPDPLVIIDVAGATSTSHTVEDTYTPTWTYKVTAKLATSSAVMFGVYDEDITTNEFIGNVDFKSGVPIKVLRKGKHTFTSSDPKYGLQKLEIDFAPVE
jgi:hypothetical protein